MQRPKNLRIKTLARSALVALGLLGASLAGAAELSTSPLTTTPSTDRDFYCIFTNLGKKSVDVTITLTDYFGNEYSLPFTASPGSTPQILISSIFAGQRRCTVSGKFSTTKARLSLQLVDASTLTTLVAVEGR
jgi:hypothetical protein